MKEMVGGCCVCSDERGWPENPLVYCDGEGCTVAVHQACYGIVTVPTGPWYCRKCESQERAARVRCELCPSRDGALKRTDNAGWAHVVCALYIPEVRFGNVTTMEPIILQLIPQERFNKTCYICQDNSKGTRASVGACMQCNKSGCRMQFHVTCAQALGLLCEEAGNYLDNVKYCGYCQHHYSKLKKVGNIKVIPPYKPVVPEHNSSDSSPEKELDAQNATTSIIQNPMHQSAKASVVIPNTGAKLESQPSKNANRKTVSSSGKSTQNPSSTSSGNASSNSTSASTNNPIISKNVMVNLSKDKHITKSIKSGNNPTKVSEKDKSSKSTKVSTSSSSSSTSTTNISTSKVVKESTESDRKTPNILEKSSGSDKSSTKKEQKVLPTHGSFTESVSSNSEQDLKLNQGHLKKRKADSRTSTPVPDIQVNDAVVTGTSNVIVTPMDTRDENHKKIKTEHSPSPPLPVDSSYGQLKINTMVAPAIPKTEVISPVPQSVLQPPPVTQPTSLVVSVPLSTASPAMSQMSNNLYQHLSREPTEQTNKLSPAQTVFLDRSSPMNAPALEQRMSNSPNTIQTVLSQGHQIGAVATLASQQSIGGDPEENLHRNDGSGGLKITFEKQVKTEDTKRSRSSRLHPTPPPVVPNPNVQGGHVLQQNNVVMGLTPKESPSSSPNPDEQPKRKGRKPLNQSSSPAPDTKQDIKLFQNGVHAPHMLGNQLNPNSNMAQKMSDHLNHEIEAHSVFTSDPDTNQSGNLVGPPLLRHTTKSGNTNMTSNNPVGNLMSGVTGGNASAVVPQSLDQLLERQWEQGSQFLMEQAQHFDIASLLSCLHQLRTENVRLEDHVNNLVTRRDHLLAVNARLAIPLTQPAGQAANTVAESAATASRAMRPMENGIVSQDIYRTQQQAQVRHSPASQYQQNSVNIQQHGNIRTASREQIRTNYQPYSVVTSQQHQVVVRREDNHIQAPQKPPN